MIWKNVYDPSAPTGNLVTTISGVVGLILTILLGIHVITAAQAQVITDQLPLVIQAITAIVGAITALISIFKAKDQ
jgi:hypothetical protein